ncbi:DUF4194 domain-containing protein [Pseudoteredinibacter isoporae]|uniref:DUF4194 domain-containing protein n=1 Tax=Pseudoteredinibacter isoporae TaxID=570281 RepID=UPI0031094419
MFNQMLQQALKEQAIRPEDFSELMIRLLDYGIINRDESQVEASLYDRYLQCQDLVDDYLSVIGVRIEHDEQFCSVRLYPPGASAPNLQDEEHSPFNQGFRHRPNQMEMALILVLRVEYEKSLREGLVDDKGCVLISMEEIAISLNNLLKRKLPDGLQERKQLFRNLRQLRIIRFNTDSSTEEAENWISIQPGISSLVNHEVLAQLDPELATDNQLVHSDGGQA